MTPAELDLTVYKNRDFKKIFVFTDGRDISDYTIAASVREKQDQDSDKIIDFTVDITDTSTFKIS